MYELGVNFVDFRSKGFHFVIEVLSEIIELPGESFTPLLEGLVLLFELDLVLVETFVHIVLEISNIINKGLPTDESLFGLIDQFL